MKAVHQFDLCLRFFGDDLVPEKITSLLGAAPDRSSRRGDPLGARGLIAKTGRWLYTVKPFPGIDFAAEVERVFDQMTPDLEVWKLLANRFEADLYFGAWMETSNEGFWMTPALMTSIASRGLSVGIDIYDPSDN